MCDETTFCSILVDVFSYQCHRLASQMDVRFAKFDTNADGEISLTEATKHDNLLKQFADLDENGDQVLSEQEFEKFKP